MKSRILYPQAYPLSRSEIHPRATPVRWQVLSLLIDQHFVTEWIGDFVTWSGSVSTGDGRPQFAIATSRSVSDDFRVAVERPRLLIRTAPARRQPSEVFLPALAERL
jgi:hypothetical protein